MLNKFWSVFKFYFDLVTTSLILLVFFQFSEYISKLIVTLGKYFFPSKYSIYFPVGYLTLNHFQGIAA